MAVNFYLYSARTNRQGTAPLRVSVSIAGTRMVSTLGFRIEPARWDADRQQMRRTAPGYDGLPSAAVNGALARIRSRFMLMEQEALVSGDYPDAHRLREELDVLTGRSARRSAREVGEQRFDEAYRQFISERSRANQWTRATVQKFEALRGHLRAWKEHPAFDDFTEAGLIEFVDVLREERGLLNSSIGKVLGYLRWFLKWALAKGMMKETAFQTFSPKLKTAARKVIFLTWEELMRVYHYRVPDTGTVVRLRAAGGHRYMKRVTDASGLRKAQGIFLFCCFTSLRYSDAHNLKRSDIHGDRISITTVKTADSLDIELNKYAREVLMRYAGDPETGEYALPRLSNQRMNVYLKELCELCEINEPVTQTHYRGAEREDETLPKYQYIGTHTGRRTFICNALSMGIPAEIVMKWTGHADYKSMRPYIDIVSHAKAEAMALFDDR